VEPGLGAPDIDDGKSNEQTGLEGGPEEGNGEDSLLEEPRMDWLNLWGRLNCWKKKVKFHGWS